MKKLAALILALAMCLSLAACSGGGSKESQQPSGSPGGSQTDAPGTDEKSFNTYTLSDWEAYADTQDGKYKVLYLVSWAASEYFQNSFAAWSKQFEALGWELEMQGPKEYTPDSQLGVLESALISQQYDAIVLFPIAPDAFAAVKDELWETYHVPIIIWGMNEDTNSGHYYLASADGYMLEGNFMAKMTMAYVDENQDYFSRYDTTNKIPVVVYGQANNPLANVRVLRAMELLEADGRFEIVEHYENVTDDKALEYAESMLLNHPEAELIIAFNDVLGLYIEAALKETSVKLSDHLRIFGCDAINAARASMASGESYFGGSIMSNHNFIGDEIIYTCRVGIPAARKGYLVDGITARNIDVYNNGEFDICVTPANVADYPAA